MKQDNKLLNVGHEYVIELEEMLLLSFKCQCYGDHQMIIEE